MGAFDSDGLSAPEVAQILRNCATLGHLMGI